MIIVFWAIAISGVLTLFVIASVGRLFDQGQELNENRVDTSPGAVVPKKYAETDLSPDDQVVVLLDAAKKKAASDFYSIATSDRTAVLGDQVARIETELFKVKMQIFTFGICVGGVSLCFGVWGAIATIQSIGS